MKKYENRSEYRRDLNKLEKTIEHEMLQLIMEYFELREKTIETIDDFDGLIQWQNTAINHLNRQEKLISHMMNKLSYNEEFESSFFLMWSISSQVEATKCFLRLCEKSLINMKQALINIESPDEPYTNSKTESEIEFISLRAPK